MRDKQYKSKGFRLNDKTIIDLQNLRQETNQSYNLLFKDMIKFYKQKLEENRATKTI